MKLNIDTSIIIPAYDEEPIIADTLHKTASFINAHKAFLGECEVVVVAAGTDATASIAKGNAPLFDHFQLVTPPGRVGKGRDVQAGFLVAKGDVQLFMDADLSTPLPHIVPMVEKLRGGADVVVGVRNLRAIHKSRLRSAVSVVANWTTRLAGLPGIRDTQCGFKGFSKAAAAALFPKITSMRWGFDVELLILAREARLKTEQLPIGDWHETRAKGLIGERVMVAARRTLMDLVRISAAARWRWCLRHVGWAPVVAALGVVGMAFLVGPSRSIWFDEAYSIFLIKHSPSVLIHYTSVDVHPPLYYLLLKGWAHVFGRSELGLRSLSIACGALASTVAVLLARYMFGARVALYAVPFVILSPLLVRYDIEARMYALASLICISATYVLVRALDARQRWHRAMLWITYAVLVAAGMYTQYYTALVWMVHAVWLAFATFKGRSFRQIVLQPWLYAYVGAIALFAPWIHTLLWQTGNVQDYFWIGPVTIREVIGVATVFLSYHPLWQLDPRQSIATMIGIVLAVWLVSSAWRMIRTQQQRRYYLLLILTAVLPVVVLYAISLPPFRPVFLDRYFSLNLLAGYLLLGVAVALQQNRRRALLGGVGLLIVLALGIGSLAQQGNYNFNTRSQPHAKEVAAYVRGSVGDSPIIVESPGQYMEMNYYLPTSHVLFYRTNPTSTSGGYAPLHNSPDRLASANELTSKTVWYLYSAGNQPKLTLPNYKLAHSVVVDGTNVSTYSRIH